MCTWKTRIDLLALISTCEYLLLRCFRRFSTLLATPLFVRPIHRIHPCGDPLCVIPNPCLGLKSPINCALRFATIMSYILFHATGCGSVLPLTILTVLNIPHELVTLDYEATTTRKDSEQLKRLISYNPLVQFPTLVTPDGAVITEVSQRTTVRLHAKNLQCVHLSRWPPWCFVCLGRKAFSTHC